MLEGRFGQCIQMKRNFCAKASFFPVGARTKLLLWTSLSPLSSPMSNTPASPPPPYSSQEERIPEPPHRHNRSYTPFLHPDDRVAFTEMKKLVQKILPEELDVKCSWGRQDKDATKRLIDRVVEAHPTFAKYENAWPVFYYSYKHISDVRRPLSRAHKSRRQRLVDRASTPHRTSVTQRAGPTSRTSDPAHEPTAQHSAAVDAGLAITEVNECAAESGSPPENHAHCSRSRMSNLGTAHGECAPGPSARPVVPEAHASRLVTVEQLTPGEQEVAQFLANVNPGFVSLIGRLRLAGITSRARLVTLAGWPAPEKEYFLVQELRLNAFERKLIGDALEKHVAADKV
ncbi:hypothetical protein C8Q77DRAFT_385784 [Trametes polyzona]|nr:hypothetical protein C8Q77DRAFT_385784 [Trametes polyzona]